MKARLAFYKGKGTIVDKAIRWWTGSNYSHVELVINGLWYSTSPRDLCVRCKNIIPDSDHWDFVEVNISRGFPHFFRTTKGHKYDWLGIFFSQFFAFNIEDKKRWFCSEWCAKALGVKNSNLYSPEGLYRLIKG
jgi:hypothetical protein